MLTFHPCSWSGPLEPNEKLNTVERLFEGQLKGPESFAARGGWLYTGLMDGRIGESSPILAIHPASSWPSTQPISGRLPSTDGNSLVIFHAATWWKNPISYS